MYIHRLALFTLLLTAAAEVGAQPTVRVAPLEAIAGSYQEMRFEFGVGDGGIQPGGGVRLELPIAYLETEPYYWDRPQVELPGARGYVSAFSTRGVELSIKLEGRQGGIVECDVLQGELQPGDLLSIQYAGVVQSLDWEVPVRAQWRSTADRAWTWIENAPRISILPLKVVTLFAVALADVQRGEDFNLAVVLLDKFGNRARRYRGTIALASSDPDAVLSAPYTFTAEDAGVHVFEGLRYNTVGFQKVTLTDGTLEGRGNYSEVHSTLPEFKRYFGETHFHTGTGTDHEAFTTVSAGGDHRGHFTTQQAAYSYCRDVMRLDFASASEHDTPHLNESLWAKCQDITDSFYEPGRFTTFYAYEWTASATVGHHLVLYKDRQGKVLNHFEYSLKPALFDALDRQARPAFVIPHCMWAQSDHCIWDHVSDRYQRVGEIYSLWNNRFLLQPGDEPQRFELGIDNRWSYQYAWHHGHKIGVIGSSDNHTGHPGANAYTAYTQHASGLAAVWATGNNREDLWQAMNHRRAYATTGTRILLEFTSDGHWMGEEYATERPPAFSVKAAGTNEIESVEVVKYDGKAYRTIHREEPGAEVCTFQTTDEGFAGDSMYYVRVSQVDEYWRSPWAKTTREMAWSSPIWVSRLNSSP